MLHVCSLLMHHTWHLFTCILVLHVCTWYLFTCTLVICVHAVENLNQERTDRRTVELKFSWECVLSHTWISPWTQKGILPCEMDPRKRSVTYVFRDDETSV